MRLFGFEITRTKAAPVAPPSPVFGNPRAWWPLVRESYTGAWQRGDFLTQDDLMADVAIFRCTTLIASDAGKLALRVMRVNGAVWKEVEHTRLSPLIRKPNRYQTRNQFVEQWLLSLLIAGNTYVLKERGAGGSVRRMYVLAPNRVKPMVADDGSVFYQLSADNMAGGELTEDIMVPASEIIHDRINTLWHPLVGISPLYAAKATAAQGKAIRNGSAAFFRNAAMPSGMLTAPGAISDETALRLKDTWQENFGGDNAGKVAVLGDGLTFSAMSMTAEASKLVEQLGMTTAEIAMSFGVPLFKLGGQVPAAATAEAANTAYLSDTLQRYLENIEACLDDGLEVPDRHRFEFDLDGLVRLDTGTLYTSLREGVTGGFLAPNEARGRLGLPPVDGGESPLAQEQNYSLAALAKRDAKPDPFGDAAASIQRDIASVKDASTALAESVRRIEMTGKSTSDATLDDRLKTVEKWHAERIAAPAAEPARPERRGKEVTKVTKHAPDGRILEFEKVFVHDDAEPLPAATKPRVRVPWRTRDMASIGDVDVR